jgi:hypothetical protein
MLPHISGKIISSLHLLLKKWSLRTHRSGSIEFQSGFVKHDLFELTDLGVNIKGHQVVFSSPKFLRGIRSEHFRNHATDRSAAVSLNGLHIADQDLAGLFNLRLLAVRQRFEG